MKFHPLRRALLGIAVIPALTCPLMPSTASAQEPATPGQAIPEDAKPANPLSYYIGLSLGEQMKSQGLTEKDIDPISLAMAIADELAGRKPRLDEAQLAEAQKGVMAMLQAREEAAMSKMRAEMETAAAANKEKATLFLAENGKKEGIKSLPSGLQYKVEKAGNGPSPSRESTVRVHYTGKLISGQVFDSSVERGQPAQFQVGQLIPGWQEALPRMKKGDKWILYVPPELAYGMRGSPPVIGPNELLIFEMELLEIVQ